MVNFNAMQPNMSFLQGYFNNPTPYAGGFGMGSIYSGAPSSSSSKKVDSEEKREKAIEKNKAEIQELKAQTKEMNEILTQTNGAVENEDGTYTKKETMEEYKKQPWWKKTLRAVGNMAQGTWKMITGFIGMEKDPETGKQKWNPLKCLKNVGIAAALIGLTCIPVVGPWISTGLLAIGVGTGAVGITKGIIDASKAETTEELDHAFQDIGQGATVGISSAIGLRGLGKGLQAGASSAVVESGTTAASTLTRSTCSSKIGQFCLDATVNAVKATKAASAASKAAVAENGFWSAWGSKIKDSMPKFGKKNFESKLADANKNLDSKINEIDLKLNDPTLTDADQITSLSNAKQALLDQKTAINTAKTRADWQKIGKSSKELAELAKSKESSMKWMSFKKENAADIAEFTGRTKNSTLGRLYSTLAPSKDASIGSKIWFWVKSPFKLALQAMGITFKPYNLVKNSPASAWYKIESTFIVPEYETPMLNSMLKMGDTPVTITQTDENGQQVAQAVTKDMVSKLKKENSKVQKQLSELNQKQHDLMYA